MKMSDPKTINKKKWLLGGLAVFGVIALASTGFAAYVIGRNVNAVNGDVTVSVETAKNESYSLAATLSDSAITLGETEVPATNNGFIREDATTAPGDLTITFSSITLTYGTAAADTLPTHLHFSLDYTNTENSANKVTTDSINKRTVTSAGYWEYISAPATVDLDKATATTSGGVATITLANKSVAFTWGSFFDNESPLNFYNGKFSDVANQTVANSDLVKTELDAMHTALDKKTIKLTATLETA